MSTAFFYEPATFRGLRRKENWKGSTRGQGMSVTFTAKPRVSGNDDPGSDAIVIDLTLSEARRVYRELHEIFRSRNGGAA